MSIALITGPAGAGKSEAVLRALHEYQARGEHPMLVLGTAVDDACRTRCSREDPAVGGARVERFDGLLAEILLRADSQLPPPLGALARERLLGAIYARNLRSGATRDRGGGASRGLVRALATLVGELEAERVAPERLRTALGAWGAVEPEQRRRAQLIADVYADYLQTLARLQRADPEQRVVAALDALRLAPARWGGTPVLLDGFDDFTRLQLDVIETLGAVVGAEVTVALTFERARNAFAARAGTFQTLLALARQHRELPPRGQHGARPTPRVLHHLERSLFEAKSPAAPPAGEAVRLLEGHDERAELELLAGEVAALLRRGFAPGEIAICHRAPGTVVELLCEVLGAHRIPYAVERRLRFADTALGRALLGLLSAACEPDAPLAALLAWLRLGDESQSEYADELEARARRSALERVEQGCGLWEAAGWPSQPLIELRELRDAATHDSARLHTRLRAELQRLGEMALGRTDDPWARLVEERALQVAGAALLELEELPVLRTDVMGTLATLRGLELVVRERWPARGAGLQAGAGVLTLLDPLALPARGVRALLLCGLQEGVFPAPAQPPPVFSEDERRQIVEISGLLALTRGPSARDALASERYLLYAAVACPTERLVLSWHAADDEGLQIPRSLFVEDLCELIGVDSPTVQGPEHEFPADIRRLQPPTIAPLRDERVKDELRRRPAWSASALEAWADCPVRWFVQRLLVAEHLEPDPEPLARGALAHAALRDVLAGLRRETGSARLRASELSRARALLHTALAAHESRYVLSTVPERVPGIRRRLQADLERYIEHAAAQDSPLEPTFLELPFGFPAEPDGLPALDLGDGVRVRGRIDRVDLTPSGDTAVVYDYKGAHAPDGGRWTRERALQIALYMRAVEQGERGLHAAGGFYQPLAGRDLRARGVLELREDIELDCVRGDTREPAEVQALVEETLALARQAAAEVRAGALQPRPDSCGFGGAGCMYPTICRCER